MKHKKIRLISRLDIKGPNLIKGIHLEGLRVIGDPQEYATKYYNQGADELIYIDIVASLYGRSKLPEIVSRTVEEVFVPLTVGGGIRNIDDVTDDLWQVKNRLYTELYGKKWMKNKSKARSIWGIEYGNSTLKPHLNIVLEDLPYPFDDYKSLFVLLDRFLPDKVRCLWRRSAHLQPIRFNKGINSYITKESDYRNSTIIHKLTDY